MSEQNETLQDKQDGATRHPAKPRKRKRKPNPHTSIPARKIRVQGPPNGVIR